MVATKDRAHKPKISIKIGSTCVIPYTEVINPLEIQFTGVQQLISHEKFGIVPGILGGINIDSILTIFGNLLIG